MHSETQGKHKGLGNNETKPVRKQYRCRAFVAVVNNYTEKEELQWKDFAQKYSLKCIIAKEVGENGTPHLQIYIEFKHPQTNFRLEKVMERGFWYNKAKGTDIQNDVYCDKEGNVWKHGFEKQKTQQEIIKENIMKKYDNVVWKPWQQEILDIKPSDRKINWICDLEGNQGKTFLRKYLCLTREAVLADGKKDNIFNQLKIACVDNDKYIDTIIMDIPRHNEKHINYGCIEQIVDQHIYSGKYEGGEIWLPELTIIIFANFYPDKEKFTGDRWNIVVL